MKTLAQGEMSGNKRKNVFGHQSSIAIFLFLPYRNHKGNVSKIVNNGNKFFFPSSYSIQIQVTKKIYIWSTYKYSSIYKSMELEKKFHLDEFSASSSSSYV